MVICGVELSPDVLDVLKNEGVTDSKRITPSRRVQLACFIEDRAAGIEFVEFGPSEIDVLRKGGTNLNRIEAIGFARIIDRLNSRKLYLDSASANAEAFADDVMALLGREVELVVEHKADVNHLPVSAASILAKVRRDERIDELKEKYGETGSGYPADYRTINFLKVWVKENGCLPEFARKTWSTAKRIISENES